jgi:hypothetical protein
MDPAALQRPTLEIGSVYTDDQLGAVFGFQPHFLRSAGGMVPVPRINALLLMTHQSDEASFAYGDYWDGNTLCYAGRGQKGDQAFNGQNRDVAENRRELWLFEHVGAFKRRFLGNPVCRTFWWESSLDRERQFRRSLRFALDFQELAPPVTLSSKSPQERRLTARPFDENRPPQAPVPGKTVFTPEQLAEMLEKRNADHHGLLVALKRDLDKSGWTDIEEMPTAIDLWARRDSERMLFEAKTITLGKELTQVRSALSQLLEYRFFYGEPRDSLCLVVDAPISDRRVRFLDATGIGVLVFDGRTFTGCGSHSVGIM